MEHDLENSRTKERRRCQFMLKLTIAPHRRIQRHGERQISDPTDSEYYDKRLARLANDLRKCPKEWRETFMAGITESDWNAMRHRGFVK
jgi:hypothetical protein